MKTKEIIKELELNYGYKFNEHERNEYSFITDLISDVQKVVSKNESLHLVSEMFDFAGYLYGNFDYHDNTKEGDIYIHNDNNLKYTREKIYQQWLGTRNSR